MTTRFNLKIHVERRHAHRCTRTVQGRAGIVLGCMLIGAFTLLSGCDNDGSATQKVNGSVHVAAGIAPNAADTVNGHIDIDDDATVTHASTVNGGIHLGAHATAESLSTVNGDITIGAGAHVAKNVESVNGGVTLADGAEVLGKVGNVNGKIVLTAAHVGGGLKTIQGSIKILAASRVEGGILIDKVSGISVHFGNEIPRITIGPGAIVQGPLHFEREVKLYVSDRATIGPVTGATPITFTGDTPPAD